MMDKFLNRNKKKVNPLAKVFYELEQLEDSPFKMALSSYSALKQESKASEDLFYYLIEDSLFTSLYATFYETLISAAKENKDKALSLINRFSECAEDRDQLIAGQAQQHLNFIEKYGMCEGCSSCDHHNDVAELIAPYQRGDIDFFTELYIGMQSIQFAFEYLIYDILPNDINLLDQIEVTDMQEFRQMVYNYSQIKFNEIGNV